LAGRSRPDIGEPIYVVAIWYLLAFPLRAAFLSAVPKDAVLLGPFYYQGAITRALEIGTLGFGALLVGYYARIGRVLGRRLPRPLGDFAPQPLTGRAFVLLGIGVCAWSYLLFVVHRLHGLDDAFSYNGAESLVVQLGAFLGYSASVAAILIFSRARRLRMAEIAVLALVLLPTVYVSIVFVRRFVLIVALVSVAIAFHYCRRRIPMLRAALLALAFLAIAFPLIQLARGSFSTLGRSTTVSTSEARVDAASQDLFGRGFAAYRHLTVETIMNRMPGVDTFAGIVQAVPNREPYSHGVPYVRTPMTAWIPRALWPGKPKDLFAQQLAAIFFGSTNFQTHLTTYNAPDLYLNFGTLGVIVGSFVLGVLYRFAHTYFIARTGRPGEVAVFLYTFVFLYLVAVEWSLTAILVTVLKSAPFVFLVVWFMGLRTTAARKQRGGQA
jgi:hypothetical protein